MLQFLPGFLQGILIFTLFSINTLIIFCFFFPLAILKILMLHKKTQRVLTTVLTWMAKQWMHINNYLISFVYQIEFKVDGLDNFPLNKKDWNLLICNHQSWLDIFILFKVFNTRLPFPKFFLKQNLKFIPIVGFACWALDFPFMRRYNKQQIKNNPSLKGKDLETARKACQIMRDAPVTVINFPEGTRFTKEKQQRQNIYQHLLRPKVSGIACTLFELQDLLKGIVNVTLIYSEKKSILDFLLGKVKKVTILIDVLPIPKELIEDSSLEDSKFRIDFQQWMNQIWREKEESILEQKKIEKTKISF